MPSIVKQMTTKVGRFFGASPRKDKPVANYSLSETNLLYTKEKGRPKAPSSFSAQRQRRVAKESLDKIEPSPLSDKRNPVSGGVVRGVKREVPEAQPKVIRVRVPEDLRETLYYLNDDLNNPSPIYRIEKDNLERQMARAAKSPPRKRKGEKKRETTEQKRARLKTSPQRQAYAKSRVEGVDKKGAIQRVQKEREENCLLNHPLLSHAARGELLLQKVQKASDPSRYLPVLKEYVEKLKERETRLTEFEQAIEEENLAEVDRLLDELKLGSLSLSVKDPAVQKALDGLDEVEREGGDGRKS